MQGQYSIGDRNLHQFISDSKRYFLFISVALSKIYLPTHFFKVKIVQGRFNLGCIAIPLAGVQLPNDVLIIY